MKDNSMINMAGTSMGSYDKPMMKGSGLMQCGCQVGKHMGGPKMMGGDERKKPMQKMPSRHQSKINANYEAADKITAMMKQKMDGTGRPDLDLNLSTYHAKAFYNKAKSLEEQGPSYGMLKSSPSFKYAQPKKAPLPGPLPKTLTKKDYRKSKK